MTPICELAERQDTDKGPRGVNASLGVFPGHNYTPTYHALFDPIRERVQSICELGVWSGGSLHVWADYFPAAFLHAVDIEYGRLDEWAANSPRVMRHLCNQSDHGGLVEVARLAGGFDIVVDDGSHNPDDMTASMAALWYHARYWYVIEDIRREHLAAYLPIWNGIAGRPRMEIQSALSPDVVALAWGR